MSRKKLFVAVLATLIAVILTACANRNASPAASATDAAGKDGLTKITFVLDWTPNTNHNRPLCRPG